MFEPFDFSETPCLAFGEEGEPDLGRKNGPYLTVAGISSSVKSFLSISEMVCPLRAPKWVKCALPPSVAQVTGCSRDECLPFHGIQCPGL